jgi:hypothetical protein
MKDNLLEDLRKHLQRDTDTPSIDSLELPVWAKTLLEARSRMETKEIKNLTKKERENWIFEFDNHEIISERISLCHTYVFGYDPLALANTRIFILLPTREPQNLDDAADTLDLENVRGFSCVPYAVIPQSPDNYSRFELLIPKLSIGYAKKGKAVFVSAIFSEYISWSDETKNVKWNIQFECNNTTYELEDCNIKILPNIKVECDRIGLE